MMNRNLDVCTGGHPITTTNTRQTHPLARLAFVALALMLAGCGTTSVTKVEVREWLDSLIVKHDTVTVVSKSDSVRIDTVWASVPGEAPKPLMRRVNASLDTTLSGVSLRLRYELPPDVWRVNVARRDTIVRWTVRDSIIQRPYEVEVVPMWVYLALGGMIVALIAIVVNRKG